MSDKIKVALCLSGEPKSSMASFPYVYESLINLGPEFEVDVYIHSWKNFRALPLYFPKNHLIDWVNQNLLFSSIYSNIVNHQITPNITELFGKIENTELKFIPYRNAFFMYLSIQKCFNLIKEPYSIYIRSRFDLYTPSELDLNPYINDILYKRCDISLPLLGGPTGPLFNDQLAICNFKGAEYYFNLFNNIPHLIDKTNSMNSHVWLESYLSNSNLKTNTNLPCPDLIKSSNIFTQYNSPYFDN